MASKASTLRKAWCECVGVRGESADHAPRSRYFVAAKASSIERHLYSVPLPSLVRSAPAESDAPTYEKVEPTELTDASERAYYGVDFSPQAGFYLLSYDGPNIPWQKVVKAGDKGACILFVVMRARNDVRRRQSLSMC